MELDEGRKIKKPKKSETARERQINHEVIGLYHRHDLMIYPQHFFSIDFLRYWQKHTG